LGDTEIFITVITCTEIETAGFPCVFIYKYMYYKNTTQYEHRIKVTGKHDHGLKHWKLEQPNKQEKGK